MADLPVATLRTLGYQAEDPEKGGKGPRVRIAQLGPGLSKVIAVSQPLQDTLVPLITKMLWTFVGIVVAAGLVVALGYRIITLLTAAVGSCDSATRGN